MKTQQTPLQRLKHHVTGAIERGEKSAIIGALAQTQSRKPRAASHSPLLARNICPHASVSFPDIDVRNLTKGQLTEEYAECNSQRQALKAHAQRLADALEITQRAFTYSPDGVIRFSDPERTQIREALAEWEQAQ